MRSALSRPTINFAIFSKVKILECKPPVVTSGKRTIDDVIFQDARLGRAYLIICSDNVATVANRRNVGISRRGRRHGQMGAMRSAGCRQRNKHNATQNQLFHNAPFDATNATATTLHQTMDTANPQPDVS
jgi:hypothetical protein